MRRPAFLPLWITSVDTATARCRHCGEAVLWATCESTYRLPLAPGPYGRNEIVPHPAVCSAKREESVLRSRRRRRPRRTARTSGERP